MANVWQWLGVGFGLGVIALGVSAFFCGLSSRRIRPSIARTAARAETGGPEAGVPKDRVASLKINDELVGGSG